MTSTIGEATCTSSSVKRIRSCTTSSRTVTLRSDEVVLRARRDSRFRRAASCAASSRVNLQKSQATLAPSGATRLSASRAASGALRSAALPRFSPRQALLAAARCAYLSVEPLQLGSAASFKHCMQGAPTRTASSAARRKDCDLQPVSSASRHCVDSAIPHIICGQIASEAHVEGLQHGA